MDHASSRSDSVGVLQRYWGHQAFRGAQQEIIETLLGGQDTLVLMPTGGGKSICFQVPALMQEGMAIVISPLIALMQDQVDNLRRRGITAAALHGALPARAQDVVLDNCIYGKTRLLYVAPERLSHPLFLARVAKMKVSLLVVDEAHCIDAWGYDFRPSYLTIAGFREHLPDVPVVALTATATPAAQETIVKELRLVRPARFVQSFARTNLGYHIRKVVHKEHLLLRWVRHVQAPTIVYAGTRTGTVRMASFLAKQGISALAYHAGLPAAVRHARQQAWVAEQAQVMVATNAFGMGIDKPNVRLVLHVDLPKSLEAYYQEAGRAGRDGKAAYAVVLYTEQDLYTMERHLAGSYPDLGMLQKVYQAVANYYQVAIGSYDLGGRPFDLADFATTYGFPLAQAHHALRRLARAGVLHYEALLSVKAQVAFCLTFQEAYAFRVAHPKYGALLDALAARHQGNATGGLVMLSTARLARELGRGEKGVIKELEGLSKRGVISYVPPREGATLTFAVPRCLPAHLPITATGLQEDRRVATRRMEAVRNYVRHGHRCRGQLLLEYFGELTYQLCGRCDICRRKENAVPELSQDVQQAIRAQVLARLKEAPVTLATLLGGAPTEEEQARWTVTLQGMLEEGVIGYDKGYYLRMCQ